MCNAHRDIHVLALARLPMVQVRLVCPEHGTVAGTVLIEEFILIAAHNGRLDMEQNGRRRHGYC